MQGEIFPAEWTEQRDKISGVIVRQLTRHKGHSNHLFFTNPGWYDGGRKLLFASDRDNQSHLFGLDLNSGEFVQLTDTTQVEGSGYLWVCVNPARDETYFWRGQEMIALDLVTLHERTIYRVPDGFCPNMLSCSADGKYVCTSIYEDFSDRFEIDLLNGNKGTRECWEARPLSQVVKVAVDGSGDKVVWEEKYFIGHVNTSPTQPNLLTFCHEGPWVQVDQRIWGCDIENGKVWKIRPNQPGERVGDEYWLADGETIGYHGTREGKPSFGFIRHDNTEFQEHTVICDSGHLYSHTRDLLVGDGTRAKPLILLWPGQGERLGEQRILCEHGTSAFMKRFQANARFSPNGKQVVFSSDRSGYCNVYSVDVPPLDTLPLYEE